MNIRIFYSLSCVGIFSLILFSSKQYSWLSPTSCIFMLAVMFAGLHFRGVAKKENLSKFKTIVYKFSPIGFPVSVLLLRYIAM